MHSEPPDTPEMLERAALARALVRVAMRDRDALQEVYRRTSRKLFGICQRIFSDRSAAEDAMQEIYLTIWHRAESFDPTRGSPFGWLATLARNRAIDILRASRRHDASPIEQAFEVADENPGAEQALIARGDDARINGCIEHLPKRDAVLIRTAFFEGSTYAELADRSAAPLGTIKSRIRRALIRLRECLRD